MYSLRHSFFRVLSKASTPILTKPRSISSAAPAISRFQQQWMKSSFQKRFYGDEAPERPTPAADQTRDKETPAVSADNLNKEAAVATQRSGTVTAEAPESAAKPTSLYIGNIFFEVTEDQLRKVFSQFGPLEGIRMIYDDRGLSRGYAFVSYHHRDDAAAAIESLHEQIFEGRRMIVQFNRQKPAQSLVTPNTSHAPTKTLFIGNMSFDMSDKDLNELFRDIQNVVDVRVAIDRKTGQPRGFAHADFVDVQSAIAAKEILAGKELYGRKMRIDFSKHSVQSRSAVKYNERTKPETV